MKIDGKQTVYHKDIEISFTDVINSLKREALGITNDSSRVNSYYISDGKVVEREYYHGSSYSEDVITDNAEKVRKFQLVKDFEKEWRNKK